MNFHLNLKRSKTFSLYTTTCQVLDAERPKNRVTLNIKSLENDGCVHVEFCIFHARRTKAGRKLPLDEKIEEPPIKRSQTICHHFVRMYVGQFEESSMKLQTKKVKNEKWL